ncbi:MAG: ABC transporter ATP-binding protein/permease [Oscillospiraceae bacterium]|jgi:ATP-binding cassette subfamily B protein|nr:ABC transporter ATP-binding protein/permease [Oscillospiraceae bacterium]
MDHIDLAFSLDESMRPVNGRLLFDSAGVITVFLDGKPALALPAKDAKEARVLGSVGCALVFLTFEDAPDRVLARFDMSRLKAAGEWCKVVNHAIETGKPVFDDAIEPEVCEKCGKTLPEGMRVCPFCFSKAGLFKRAWALLRPFKREILISQTFMAMSSALYVSVPVLNRILIDNYLAPKLGTAAEIMLLAGFMFLARAIGETIYVLSARVYARAGTLFSNYLRDIAYAKIQKLSMAALGRRTPGELIRRVMEDTVTIKDFLTDYGRWMMETGLMFIVSMVILGVTNWRLALLVFAPVPIVGYALYRFRNMIQIRYERQWRKNSRAQSILHDIIKGIRTVKSFGAEDREIEKFARVSKDLAAVMTSNETMWALLFPAVTFFSGIGEFFVLYVGGRWILGGQLSLGVLVQFTMFLGYIYQPLRWLVSFPRVLADAMTSLVKMFEILDEEADIQETAMSKDAAVEGAVDYQSVSFGYKSYEPVLKEVGFTIEPGEMIGIVGKSGAGKSTLINLMLRLYDPNTGRITLGGDDLRSVSPRRLHERAGVVFQDTFLFAGTIYDNILYAKPDATPAEVIAACAAANAHEFIMKSADGYDTLIGESGFSLSGGERQRLAIARAIIKNPRLLILDEATSSLDLETESIIQDSLNNLTRKRTTIAIAHRLSTLRAANRLIVLDKGRIAEIGTHVELLRKKGIYYKLVMAQRQTSRTAEA